MLKMKICIAVVFATCGMSFGEVVQNLLTDPGFEPSNISMISETSSPWFAVGKEGLEGCLLTSVHAHGGTQSAEFKYYFSQSGIAQNTGHRIEAGKIYEISFWMLIDEPASDAKFINTPTVTMALWSSPQVEGPYQFRLGLFNRTPTVAGEWQKFSYVIPAKSALSEFANEYVQVRVTKPKNATHRIFVDDIAFGSSDAKPSKKAKQTEKGNGKSAQTTPYRRWASMHGLKGSEALPNANPDGDALNNLYEYGLGGNPTDGNDVGMTPIYGNLDEHGTNFAYIYPRRIDANKGLIYRLERNGRTVTKDECEEMNTAKLNDEYDAIVMRISPEVENKQDIQLKLILNEDSAGKDK
ncbi:MAG: hypothetical protein K9M54_08995 [Kiritimatiellales bacterium]|nr:hypothetical protein [Kiritimatiellales bacterium]